MKIEKRRLLKILLNNGRKVGDQWEKIRSPIGEFHTRSIIVVLSHFSDSSPKADHQGIQNCLPYPTPFSVHSYINAQPAVQRYGC